MSKNYDMIATVNINIASPIVDNSSYEHILIVGPLPAKAPATAPAAFDAYSTIEQVEAAGWVTSGPDADPIGMAASVAFSQEPAPSVIYIAPVQEGKTVVDAIKTGIHDGDWYAVCPAGIDKDSYADIAAYIETQEKVFCYTDMDVFSGDAPAASVDGEFYRTLGFYGRVSTDQADDDIPVDNKYLHIAAAVRWLAHRPGSETAAFKTLTRIVPSALSPEEMESLASLNMNYFITIGAKNVTMNGKVLAGEWADIIRFRDWLKNDIQVRVVNLFTANAKVPYTDHGIALVQNQMIAALKNGQSVGGIVPDEYNDAGILVPGFKTSVPRAAAIPAAVRQSRALPVCKFSAKLAGAIHFVDIDGSLSCTI